MLAPSRRQVCSTGQLSFDWTKIYLVVVAVVIAQHLHLRRCLSALLSSSGAIAITPFVIDHFQIVPVISHINVTPVLQLSGTRQYGCWPGNPVTRYMGTSPGPADLR
jgi:hypothetical protein